MAMKAVFRNRESATPVPDEINLVCGENLAVSRFVLPRACDVDHTHNHVGPLHRPLRPFDPLAFDGVFGFAQACGVRDPKGNPPQACEVPRLCRGWFPGWRSRWPDQKPRSRLRRLDFPAFGCAAKNQADSFAEDPALLGSREQAFRSGNGFGGSRRASCSPVAGRCLLRENLIVGLGRERLS